MYTSVVYDGTWLNLLTGVFEVYERKLDQVTIYRKDRFQPGVFGEVLTVVTNAAKATRVWAGLKAKLSSNSLNDIFSCFLSEMDGIENTLLTYIRLVFSSDQSMEQAFGHSAVLRVSQISRIVHREKHRMEAFIRFQLTRDGIYYSGIEPDFNVIPLILKHFEKRYADQKWIIYDLKRRYGIYYNLVSVEEITFEFSSDVNPANVETLCFSEDEALYQALWKDYFKHVNIPVRKNMKLHLRHVPTRYWKHLTEKLV